MARKSSKSSKSAAVTSERDMLKTVYLYVVNNWAVTTADAVNGVDAKIPTERLLKKLRSKSLIDATHVNGEKALTWQSNYDIENTDADETLASAERDFDAAFPVKAEPKPAAKPGATGPRYSDAQLSAGAKAKAAGKSRREVAEAAGVKSPNYFNTVLAKREADAAKVKKAAARKTSKAAKSEAKS